MAGVSALPKQFQRLYAESLDSSSTYYDTVSLMAYVSSPTSYPSQIISLVDIDNNKVTLYKIMPDKTIQQLIEDNLPYKQDFTVADWMGSDPLYEISIDNTQHNQGANQYLAVFAYQKTDGDNIPFQKYTVSIDGIVSLQTDIPFDGFLLVSTLINRTVGDSNSTGVSDYALLTHKPILNTNNISSLPLNNSEEMLGIINLHKISKSGKYSDLIGIPSSLPHTIQKDASNLPIQPNLNFTGANITITNDDANTSTNIEVISPVTRVNGKLGDVVLKTSDVVNDSGYISDSKLDNITIGKHSVNGMVGLKDFDLADTDVVVIKKSDGTLGYMNITKNNSNVYTQIASTEFVMEKVIGAISLQGSWNALTNSPDISSAQIGNAWIINVAGNTPMGDISTWGENDWIIKGNTGWVKINNSTSAITWGIINGDITHQADLKALLDTKMNLSLFDTNNNGIIDKAESIDDGTNISTALEIRQSIDKSHTHANETILDGTQESFTTSLKSNYDGTVAKSHDHSNKPALDKISYTGSLPTIDLLQVEANKTNIENKANLIHIHVVEDITNLSNLVDGKALSLDSNSKIQLSNFGTASTGQIPKKKADGSLGWVSVNVDASTLEDVTAIGISVGGINEGDTVLAGTTLTDFVKKLIQKTIPPTYTLPTLVLTNGTLSYEIGSNVNVNMSNLFTTNDSGGANESSFDIKKNGVSVGGTFGTNYTEVITGISSNTSYQATVDYLEGAIKNDNMGNPYPTGHVLGGTVNSNTLTFTTYRKNWIVADTNTTTPLNSNDVRLLSGDINGNVTSPYTLNIPQGTKRVVLALLGNKTITVNQQNLGNITGSFVKSIVSVSGNTSDQNMTDYSVFTFLPSMAYPSSSVLTIAIV